MGLFPLLFLAQSHQWHEPRGSHSRPCHPTPLVLAREPLASQFLQDSLILKASLLKDCYHSETVLKRKRKGILSRLQETGVGGIEIRHMHGALWPHTTECVGAGFLLLCFIFKDILVIYSAVIHSFISLIPGVKLKHCLTLNQPFIGCCFTAAIVGFKNTGFI